MSFVIRSKTYSLSRAVFGILYSLVFNGYIEDSLILKHSSLQDIMALPFSLLEILLPNFEGFSSIKTFVFRRSSLMRLSTFNSLLLWNSKVFGAIAVFPMNLYYSGFRVELVKFKGCFSFERLINFYFPFNESFSIGWRDHLYGEFLTFIIRNGNKS